MLLQQVQRQLTVYQDSRKAASDDIARLTGSNISLSTELEITKLQNGDLSRKQSELKVRIPCTRVAWFSHVFRSFSLSCDRCMHLWLFQASSAVLIADRDEALRRLQQEQDTHRETRANLAALQRERSSLEANVAQLRASAAAASTALENERLRIVMLEERLVSMETGLPDEGQWRELRCSPSLRAHPVVSACML